MAGAELAPSCVRWQCAALAALTAPQLHAMWQLRQQVFVVEQMCPYPDIDGRDPDCLHLLAEDDAGLLATLRVVPPNKLPPHLHERGDASIGRVCTALRARGSGIGRELVQRGLQELARAHPGIDCVIGAQAYLRRFYESFGFVVFDDPYLEDGIPHFHMRRRAD